MDANYYGEKVKRWDSYFHDICVSVSKKSPCLSRQIGAILVCDHSVVSTGYNGPPRDYPHCKDQCPRRAKGYKSGEGLLECPAVHAEANCIANAARCGTHTIGTTLYMNCIIPCKDCMALLINAGVKEIVVDEVTPYHALSLEMLQRCNIKIRSFAK
jgi:dCMP deaminase